AGWRCSPHPRTQRPPYPSEQGAVRRVQPHRSQVGGSATGPYRAGLPAAPDAPARAAPWHAARCPQRSGFTFIDMTMTRRNKRYIGLTAGLGLALLAGCSQFNQLMGREESVDYRSTVSGSGNQLVIPPDLTQAGDNAHYRAPQ